MGQEDKGLNECYGCSHMQLWNGDKDRKCSYYHNLICIRAYEYCKGEHWLDKNKYLSIYSLEDWISRLDYDEKKQGLCISIGFDNVLKPLMLTQYITVQDEYWKLLCEYGVEQDEEQDK